MRICLFSLILTLSAICANAQISTSDIVLTLKPASISRWGAKIETDAKTTRDKQNTIDGFSTETDFQLHQMFNEVWGIVGGVRLVNESRDEKKGGFHFDEASMGIRNVIFLGDTKWRSQFTYDYLLLDEDQKSNSRRGALSADLRASMYLGFWGKLRLKLKHSEYLPNQDVGIEIRQTKLELSPSLIFKKLSTGVKNKISHLWTDRTEYNTVDVGPFVRYEGESFEPLFKIMYRPIDKSKSMIIADNWQSKPVYSVEVEMKF